ncbi:hypothetical protein BDQ17DRAFT_583330 [Cyathus striatus]|nr:hypothetical protein BDQ17DRAFT_583330 [Cyathus striatus]
MTNGQPWRQPDIPGIYTFSYPPPPPPSKPRLLSSSHHPHPHPRPHPHGPILVRDPPRERLRGSKVEPFNSSSLTRCPGRSDCDLDSTDAYSLHIGHHSPAQPKMTKKRRSLQSILVPSFLQASTPPSPTSPTSLITPANPTGFTARMRSYSSVDSSSFYDSPPPDFLLDEDPFANLSAAPVAPAAHQASVSPEDSSRAATPTPSKPGDATTPPKPRSPLTPPSTDTAKPAILAPSPRSSGVSLQRGQLPPPLPFSRIQPRPAYQKPAFRPRPSLPSLHSLARMEYVVPKKVRSKYTTHLSFFVHLS